MSVSRNNLTRVGINHKVAAIVLMERNTPLARSVEKVAYNEQGGPQFALVSKTDGNNEGKNNVGNKQVTLSGLERWRLVLATY